MAVIKNSTDKKLRRQNEALRKVLVYEGKRYITVTQMAMDNNIKPTTLAARIRKGGLSKPGLFRPSSRKNGGKLND